jgi:hypothetical protein
MPLPLAAMLQMPIAEALVMSNCLVNRALESF